MIATTTRKGLIVDNFCGGGGASSGIKKALGRHPDLAVNHDPHSIQMHQANHPDTFHYLNDVWGVDPLQATSGDDVLLGWFSPDCRHFSKAKGGTPVKKEIRDLAWVAVKWLRATHPQVVIVENVEEFQTWGPLIPVVNDRGEPLVDPKTGEPLMKPDPDRKGETFEKWVRAFKQEGYSIDWKELVAADYGAPTTRKRLFIIARRDGKPIKWPEPTHCRREFAEEKGLKPWESAASIIDWSIPCPSIFDRKRPLADNTCKRIAHGIVKYVLNNPEPFIVRSGHTSSGPNSKVKPVGDALSTIVTKNSHMLVSPALVPRYGEREGQAPRVQNVEDPLATIVPTANGARMVATFLAKHYGGTKQQMACSIERPFPTITQRGTQNQVVEAALAPAITKFYGSSVNGHGVDEPLRTVTAGGQHFGLTGCSLQKAFHTTEHETHGRSFEGSGSEPDRGQTQRRDMAPGLDATGQDQKDRTSSDGHTSQVRVPRSSDHGGSEVLHGGSPSSRVDSDQRTHSSGDGHQPSRREQGQQRSVESGVGDAVSEHQACLPDGPVEVTVRPDTKTGNRRGKASEGIRLILLKDREEAGYLSDERFQSAAGIAAFIMKFYGSGGQWQVVDGPLHTIPTKGRFALVLCTISGQDYVITDIGMRMLTPRELARAQGFPADYHLVGTKTEQIARIGNSVVPTLAEAIVRSQFPKQQT